MSSNPRITEWRDLVVWIVGGSSGRGRATAARLHALGAVVVLTARRQALLDDFVASHPGSLALAADVTDRVGLAAAAQQVLALRGRIDLVMFCAGHYRAMTTRDFDADQALQQLRINHGGALRLLAAVLPLLHRQGHGHLSLVASVAGYRGLPLSLAYGPTKAALQQLAETLCFDLRPAGIGVSVINPGFVATPMTAGNRFKMPGLMSPEQAALRIVQGWARGRFDIHFPRRLSWPLRWLRCLPHGLYLAIVRRSTGI